MSTSFENGWLRAIDEELVSTHIGVVEMTDTYEIAKSKFAQIIAWHVAVATDPAVNGGFKLVPLEPKPAASDHQYEVERWTQGVLDLVTQYGRERATEAYHGDLHCRKAPEEVFAEIEKALAAAPKPEGE